MRIERWIILILGITLLRMLWQQYRRRLRRWWKQTKDQLPRHWQPKSPADCPLCCAETERTPEQVLGVKVAESYAESKNGRGRKKSIRTEGYACPDVDCKYYGVTEASRHTLVGHGKLGEHKDIQRLKCQACGGTFSCRKGTPLYCVKTEADEVEEVLWWMAEGVDMSVLVRKTGYSERTVNIISFVRTGHCGKPFQEKSAGIDLVLPLWLWA